MGTELGLIARKDFIDVVSRRKSFELVICPDSSFTFIPPGLLFVYLITLVNCTGNSFK
jgi:hypothetical protein